MQYQTAHRRGDTRVGFLDPSLINQSQHDYPLRLKDDSKELREGKTKEGRKKIRAELLRKYKRKVVSYIVTALKFLHEDNRDQIFDPYNFKYVENLAFNTQRKFNTKDHTNFIRFVVCSGHWIYLYIMPRESMDSLDFEIKRYSTILNIIRW